MASGHIHIVKSPEYEAWHLQKEKIEAKKNFKVYIHQKIDRIVQEPSLQFKLMRKIEKIKAQRMQDIKDRKDKNIGSNLMSRLKEHRESL